MAQTSNRQQRRRQATIEEIKATARRQIAESGAAGLSLGAIARAMDMTPPALYRYFKNRRQPSDYPASVPRTTPIRTTGADLDAVNSTR